MLIPKIVSAGLGVILLAACAVAGTFDVGGYSIIGTSFITDYSQSVPLGVSTTSVDGGLLAMRPPFPARRRSPASMCS